jgi:hypothetical protein
LVVVLVVSVEDLKDPEVEAFELLLENQPGGAVRAAGISQDHYPQGQSLMTTTRERVRLDLLAARKRR